MVPAKVMSVASAAANNTFSPEHYIRQDDPAVEPEMAGGAALQEQICQITSRIQAHNFSLHRHGTRGTHVKTQAIVKGTFRVAPELPEYLAQGICSPKNAKRSHPVAIRSANEPSFLQNDCTPDPRGCGMQISFVRTRFHRAPGMLLRKKDENDHDSWPNPGT
jgi:hypothetical protein